MANATTYTLNISFDTTGLEAANAAEERLIITKSHGSTVQSNTVIWLSLQPGEFNTITWQENYGLYASQVAELAPGESITTGAEVPNAQKGQWRYPFLPALTFGPPIPDRNAPNAYSLVNQTLTSRTFGLIQYANVNGTNTGGIVNAAVVPAGQYADFSAELFVSIGLAATINNGSIIANILNTPFSVQFSSSLITRSITYSTSTGTFYSTDGN